MVVSTEIVDALQNSLEREGILQVFAVHISLNDYAQRRIVRPFEPN